MTAKIPAVVFCSCAAVKKMSPKQIPVHINEDIAMASMVPNVSCRRNELSPANLLRYADPFADKG